MNQSPFFYPRLPEIDIDAQGELLLAGHPAHELVARHGSPLVVILEDALRRNCRAWMHPPESGLRYRMYYASKALLTSGLAALMHSEGLGIDVVSMGEMATALAGGVPPEMILMHGNAKDRSELQYALEHRVGRIVIDNLEEITRLAELAREAGIRQKVFVRVTPGVRPSTHRYVQTGQQDSKFGFNLEGGLAEQAVQQVLRCPELELVGLHCHIGSQVLESEPFVAAAGRMLEFYAHVQGELGAPLDELNLGGGIGIRYRDRDAAMDPVLHMSQLYAFVTQWCEDNNVTVPLICDEPGRSIIGETGVTLYTVQSTKQIENIRNYASVDGGMTDNPRFALYEARHPVAPARRMYDAPDQLWSVSGKCCETGDMLIHDVEMCELHAGDLMAFFSTGAYTWSMASNYNRVARPAVLLLAAEREGLLARRETTEDLLRLDCIPDWLTA
ncbi:diaminopimelate decarboxylase [bacterium]|nr:diaminopimelate decarboxylase [bacterium]